MIASVSRDVAILGAAGFIGRSLTAALENRGFGCLRATRKSHGSFETATPSWFANAKLVVYVAGVVPARVQPGRDLTSNLAAARAVGKAAQNAGIEQFVLVSSASVYGTNHKTQVAEETPLTPEGEYGQICVEVESIANSFLQGVDLTIVRPFSVYGPGGHGLVDRLLDAAQEETLIELFAPDSVRDYIHVDDVARSVVQLIGRPGVFNLGTGIGRTTREVVKMAMTAEPSLESLITWKDTAARTPDSSVADTALANSIGLSIKDRLPEYLQGGLS